MVNPCERRASVRVECATKDLVDGELRDLFSREGNIVVWTRSSILAVRPRTSCSKFAEEGWSSSCRLVNTSRSDQASYSGVSVNRHSTGTVRSCEPHIVVGVSRFLLDGARIEDNRRVGEVATSRLSTLVVYDEGTRTKWHDCRFVDVDGWVVVEEIVRALNV